MRIIGLIGGMSWESSAEYYRLLNEGVKDRLGGLHSARCLLYSVDFAEIERLQHAGQWAEAGQVLIGAAQALERGGAEGLILCTNTMHKLADEIAGSVQIPFLHIADATAERVKKAGIQRVGLLGTGFTMEQDFYKGRLEQKYGLEVLVPEAADRQIVHRVIYDELCLGRVEANSKAEYLRVMAELVRRGAQGLILGCTEIMLLVGPADASVPVFDTTALHVGAALDWMLAGVPEQAGSA